MTTNLRYERKCRIERTARQQVLYHIKRHPAFFRTLFAPRQINNIYFDTLQFKFYKANELGIANRKKVRIRWYGALSDRTVQPQLEIKLKSGLVGDKLVYALPDFSLKEPFSADLFANLAKTASVPEYLIEELKSLQPVLFNTYQRSYFQSADKQFRLTFDEEMAFYRPSFLSTPSFNRSSRVGAFILELKYDLERDALAREILQYLPYRLTKNSKYVNGVELLRLV